jgi:hypothetical protein
VWWSYVLLMMKLVIGSWGIVSRYIVSNIIWKLLQCAWAMDLHGISWRKLSTWCMVYDSILKGSQAFKIPLCIKETGCRVLVRINSTRWGKWSFNDSPPQSPREDKTLNGYKTHFLDGSHGHFFRPPPKLKPKRARFGRSLLILARTLNIILVTC